MIADYDAKSTVERKPALGLANVLWRQRRAIGIEAAFFESENGERGLGKHGHSRLSLVGGTDLPEHNQLHLVAAWQSEAAATNEHILGMKEHIGRRFIRLAELPAFPLNHLSRYEHLLWQQARQIVFTLELLRRSKREPGPLKFSILIPPGLYVHALSFMARV